MGLVAGTRLGAYEIVALIGAGGMGEVYRAKDTRLKREVAIKVLPESVSHDPERLARFQREAELLATLNHPNIGAIYGVEQSESANAIVLELIDGDTLADRLKRGALPVAEALEIARQIAEALEAAHEHGIIHRDLKPANIKLAPNDKVKVLDFGLAKAMESSPANAALSHSPTLSVMATHAGVVMGTASYMSPEQAKGFPVDKRSDVFAFGAVLYEMLTGRQLFQGDTAPDVLASVIVREVDLGVLPPSLNPRITELLKRCLNKNPRKRWQAIGDVRAEIETIAATPHSAQAVGGALPVPALRNRFIAVAIAILATASMSAAVAYYVWPAPIHPTVARFSFALDEAQQFTNTAQKLVGISPDGSQILYVANQTLYLRSISSLEASPIPGSQIRRGGVLHPVFAPDGRSIAFWTGADRTLKKIAVSGGAAVTITEAEIPTGMSWSEHGIVYGQDTKGIMRVGPNGGRPEVLISVANGESVYAPQMLPGGRAVIFTLVRGLAFDRWDRAQIVVQSLQSGERKTLVRGGSDGAYVPTGHLVYALGGTAFAVPFDIHKLEVTGGPVPVVEGVRRGSGAAQLSFSTTGSLVYIPGPASTSTLQRGLGFLDRKGIVEPLNVPAGPYVFPRVSPNGKRIALGSDDGKEESIWIYDLSGTSSMRRLTFGGHNRFPMWSADGQRVAFQSDRDGDFAIFWQRADGTGQAERLTKPEPGTAHIPESWSPIGDTFLFTETKDTGVTLFAFSMKDRRPAPFGGVQSRVPITPVFSPDGRWVAYTSMETGRAEVFVQPFPSNGTKYQISKNGGHHPLWSADGSELLWDVTAGLSEILRITTQTTLTLGNPVELPRGSMAFASEASNRPVDMAPDGRILGAFNITQATSGASTAPQIRVVLNWFEDLKQRLASN
jgi:serine/threonine protein kinase/Tol biopolymer transport system component